MNGYHVVWNRSAVPLERQINDFDLVTWLASILAFQSHSGPMSLLTDAMGADYARRIGLTDLYQGGIHRVFDDFSIRHQALWSLCKIEAHRQIPLGGVVMDLDAVLWHPINARTDVVAMNREPVDLPIYTPHRELFGRDVVSAYSWDVEALNTAVLQFNHPDLRDTYLREVDTFCANYQGGDKLADAVAVPFFEQRLLAMIVDHGGHTASTLATYSRTSNHLEQSNAVMHLWGTKFLYLANPPSRAVFVQHMARWLVGQNNEAVNAILRQSQPGGKDMMTNSPVKVPFAPLPMEAYIRDANVPAFRAGVIGERVYPCEVVYPR